MHTWRNAGGKERIHAQPCSLASASMRTRMGKIILLADVLPIDMRVNLGCGDVSVTENLLHDAQVCASAQHVRRKRVPQRVRVQVRDTHLQAAALDNTVDTLARDALSSRIEENRGRVRLRRRAPPRRQ